MRRRRRRRKESDVDDNDSIFPAKKKYHFPAKISFSGTSSTSFPGRKKNKISFSGTSSTSFPLRRSLLYNFVFLSI